MESHPYLFVFARYHFATLQNGMRNKMMIL